MHGSTTYEGYLKRLRNFGGRRASVRRCLSACYVVSYTDAGGRQATVSTTVAQHPGDIPTGTLRAIERDLLAAFGPHWLRGGQR